MIDFLKNDVLFWGLISCGTAQILKIVFELIKNKRLRFSIIFETGGMPSSHSSLVTASSSALGWKLGFNDPIFALSVALALVVMYDASGIRKAAGLNAEQTNFLMEKINSDSNLSRILDSLQLDR